VLSHPHGRGWQGVEEILRRHEEQRAGDRGGEVENSIVVAGGSPMNMLVSIRSVIRGVLA
jgi:hypothetical protein